MNTIDKIYVERLLQEYAESKPTKLDELRSLDRLARNTSKVYAYVFGIAGAMLLMFGMSLVVASIEYMLVGLVSGAFGLFMTSVNYPIYTRMLYSSKQKYKEKILEICNNLLDE